LRGEIAKTIEQRDSVEDVLSETCCRLASALSARKSDWKLISERETNLPAVNFTMRRAEIFVPVAESPFYSIHLDDFSGGRRLLSGELEMLEAGRAACGAAN
jgi:hypothetical protein